MGEKRYSIKNDYGGELRSVLRLWCNIFDFLASTILFQQKTWYFAFTWSPKH